MLSNYALNNKRIAINTMFLYARMILVLIVSLYTTRVVLNALGIVDYGIYNVVAGFVSMFAFFNTAMANSIQRFYNYVKINNSIEQLRIVYNTAFRIQFLLAIIIFILIESFGLWYIFNKMTIPSERFFSALLVFHFSSLSLFFLIIQVPYSASIISHEKMSFFAFASLADVVQKLIVAILLFNLSYDKLVLYGGLIFIVSLNNFVLYYFYAKRNFPEIKLCKYYDRTVYKEIILFAGWNTFGAFAYMIQGQGLNVLANFFFGPVVNAARGISFQIQNAINGFSENIATAFRPQLVESYAKKDYGRTETLMFSMSKYCFLMLAILTIPIIIELDYILNIWLNGIIPDYTQEFTVLVLINMLLGALNMPISQTVQATGKIRKYQLLRSCLVVSTLPIAWFFLKLGYSPSIIFIVTIVISIVNQPLSMILLHRNFKFSYRCYCKKVLIPCIGFLTFAPILPVVFSILFEDGFIRLVFIVMLSLLSSIIIAYYFVLAKEERIVLKQFVSKLFKR